MMAGTKASLLDDFIRRSSSKPLMPGIIFVQQHRREGFALLLQDLPGGFAVFGLHRVVAGVL